MAIKEKTILIVLHNLNIKYYESLEYDLSSKKREDANKKLSIMRGTMLEVKVEDLQKSSKTKLTKICDICGKESPNQTYKNILIRREKNEGIDRCLECGHYEAWKTSKENIIYENSFEYKYPEISKQWHATLNGNVSPDKITYGSKDIFWWTCPDCNSPYDMTVYSRSSGSNCPFCRGMRVNDTNCLATTNPNLISEWDFEKNKDFTPFNVPKSSGARVWWKCSICNFEWNCKIVDRTGRDKTACPKCSESKGEKIIYDFMFENGIKFIPQYRFKDCKYKNSLPFDFMIFDKDKKIMCAVEYDGQHHEEPVRFGGMSQEKADIAFNLAQKKDAIKTNYCLLNKIPLIRISYWDFDEIESILFNEFIDLGILVEVVIAS